MLLKRLIGLLIAMAVIATGLAALGPAPKAVAAVKNPPCIPAKATDVYCASSLDYNLLDAAWKWSDAHKDKDDRRPVPYPGGKPISWYYNGYYVVYLVTYRTPSNPLKQVVYKYGYTGQDRWQDRANASKKDCNDGKWQGKRGAPKPNIAKNSCQMRWVMTSRVKDGQYWARYGEASLIKAYERKWGWCPTGQADSCR